MSEDDEFADVLESAEPEAPPATSRGKGTAKRRASRPRVPKRVSDLNDALARQMFQAGTIIGLAMPVTGFYVAQESAGFAEAITRLAAKDARYLEALESLASVGPGVMIGRTVLGIGCAMGVDRWSKSEGMRGFSPDSRAAMLLGVTRAYAEVHGDGQAGAAAPGFTPPPAAVFVPVA